MQDIIYFIYAKHYVKPADLPSFLPHFLHSWLINPYIATRIQEKYEEVILSKLYNIQEKVKTTINCSNKTNQGNIFP